ncbi:MAG TPA: hypothetical protein VF753_11145 [Terriglobales bacterium]
MNLAAISGNQQMQTYFQERSADLSQLGQDLKAGNLTAAQQEDNDIVTLGQSGPFVNGDSFALQTRQQDFEAIGQNLQSGNLSAAEQAYQTLQSTFQSSSSANALPPLEQQVQTYGQQRQSDISQLGQDLKSGNLSAAQADFNNLVTLGQQGPLVNGTTFASAVHENDFQNIGTALQSGDVAAALQAFQALQNS